MSNLNGEDLKTTENDKTKPEGKFNLEKRIKQFKAQLKENEGFVVKKDYRRKDLRSSCSCGFSTVFETITDYPNIPHYTISEYCGNCFKFIRSEDFLSL